MGRPSSTVQTLVALGLLARVAIGVPLFWISYLRLPMLTSLQLSAGFWQPMLDARGYFDTAASAVERGLSSISPSSPSPFFTRALTLWMQIVGVSPASGMLLNLCLYLGCCALLTRVYRPAGRWAPDAPLLLTLATVSFSPVLLIDSTQPLKDDLFFSLVVTICATTLLMLRSLGAPTARGRSALVASLGALALAIYAAAGIRSYYALLVLACLAATLTGFTFSSTGRRLRTALAGVLILSVVSYAYVSGAGSHVRPNPDERRRIAESLHWERGLHAADGAFGAVGAARRKFVRAGGDTNIVAAHGSLAATVGLGLAIIVVPISILKATSLVSFSGGRGLLMITDADTVVMDLSLIGLGVFVFRRRHLIGDRRTFVWFGLTLAVLTAVLLGYVVTNFGTLFRLRYLVAAPLWTLALAVSPRPAVSTRR